ncbi:energy transducer TonB [Desulfurivibrio dismutans]|uniref:energy transducer TonB n=1 Tax=Desulfurivibrio dismutans TaxID=1398908 RepID=UPI0023DAE769|nr:energy transducer TonB [Desulfurivibrio alkaliphilus]MDF1615058.1 energy transducer TonB [Desulfurivibrio alkaliphilus]
MSYRRRAIVISCLVHGVLAVLLLAAVRLTPSAPELLVIDFSISDAPGSAATPEPVPTPPAAEEAAPIPPGPPPKPPVELAEARPLKSAPDMLLPITEPEPEPAPVAPPEPAEMPAPEITSEPVAPPPPVTAADPGDGAGEPAAPSAAAGSPPPTVDQYLEANFRYIMEDIQQGIVYPRLARRMGWEGKVVISFVVLEDGRVEDVEVVESSGFSLLDENAVQTIKNTAPFPSPPARAILVVPVTYRLS